MIYRELLSYIYSVLYANYLCSQWSNRQRIRLNLPISAFYPPFQRFIPISAFYPHFSVLSPFQFPLSVSVSAIPFQRFIPTPLQSSTRRIFCITQLSSHARFPRRPDQPKNSSFRGLKQAQSKNRSCYQKVMQSSNQVAVLFAI